MKECGSQEQLALPMAVELIVTVDAICSLANLVAHISFC